MPRIRDTTDRQSFFLRSFRTSPTGPAPKDWPSPAILRRWLRRPGFRRALDTVLAALRFQADFHLQTAATHAANKIATASTTQDSALRTQDLKPLADLMRLSHIRQRFSNPRPLPRPTRLTPTKTKNPSR